MLFYNEKIFKRCFDWRGKYWYKNIKEIPRYFKLMRHLIKYGYDEYATWETFGWFIDTMQEVLTAYRKTHIGYPIFDCVAESKEWDELAKKYDADLDRMVELLDLMDENSERYTDIHYIEKRDSMTAAKDEFFELFSKYFYNLWD